MHSFSLAFEPGRVPPDPPAPLCLPLRRLQVSQVSESARAAIEAAGGSVATVYYNKLGLRALLKPDWFAAKGRLLPRPARPPPKLEGRFDRVGELPPRTELPAAAAGAAAASQQETAAA